MIAGVQARVIGLKGWRLQGMELFFMLHVNHVAKKHKSNAFLSLSSEFYSGISVFSYLYIK